MTRQLDGTLLDISMDDPFRITPLNGTGQDEVGTEPGQLQFVDECRSTVPVVMIHQKRSSKHVVRGCGRVCRVGGCGVGVAGCCGGAANARRQ